MISMTSPRHKQNTVFYFHPAKSLFKLPIILGALLLSILQSSAAVHYIRAGASGSQDGSSWVNAWGTLSAVKWIRGDTYYLAGGTYAGGVISATDSGTLWITVKKANAADNAADSFTSVVSLQGSRYEINGVTGSGTSGHGIKFHDAAGTHWGLGMVDGAGGYKLYHLEIRNAAYNSYNSNKALWDNSTVRKGLHIRYCWIHEASNDGTSLNNLRGTSYSDFGLLFEDNYLTETGGAGDGGHGQGMKFQGSNSYCIIRNNVFRNNSGTATIAFLDVPGDAHTFFRIYGNIFYKTDLARFPLTSPAVIWGRDMVTTNDFEIFNNTFWGYGNSSFTSTNSQIQLWGNPAAGGSALRNSLVNNLFENGLWSTGGHVGFSTVSNNGYFSNTGAVPSGSIGQVNGSSSAFVSAATGNFNLASNAYAIGKAKDISGLGLGAFRDLGALQFGAGSGGTDTGGLPAPSNTRVSITP
jgi:hypothetical protein